MPCVYNTYGISRPSHLAGALRAALDQEFTSSRVRNGSVASDRLAIYIWRLTYLTCGALEFAYF